MSDESSSSGTQRTPQHNLSEPEAAGEEGDRDGGEGDGATDVKACKRRVQRKRLVFLDDLLSSIHAVVCVQLVIVYYLDNSFIRLVFRAVIHMMSLAPRNPAIAQTETQPYIGYIFGTNIICLACHAYFAAPAAGEDTRFYLHGGLSVDFIGQRGPTSKIRLALMDGLIFALQAVMLSVLMKQKALKERLSSAADAPGAVSDAQAAEPRARSIEEAALEELGLVRQPSLDSMSPSPSEGPDGSDEGRRGDVRDDDEEDEYYRSGTSAEAASAAAAAEVLDALRSGQGSVASLYVLGSLREVHGAYSELVATRPRPSQALAASISGFFANRRVFRLRAG